jgi:hypothetical protein
VDLMRGPEDVWGTLSLRGECMKEFWFDGVC